MTDYCEVCKCSHQMHYRHIYTTKHKSNVQKVIDNLTAKPLESDIYQPTAGSQLLASIQEAMLEGARMYRGRYFGVICLLSGVRVATTQTSLSEPKFSALSTSGGHAKTIWCPICTVEIQANKVCCDTVIEDYGAFLHFSSTGHLESVNKFLTDNRLLKSTDVGRLVTDREKADCTVKKVEDLFATHQKTQQLEMERAANRLRHSEHQDGYCDKWASQTGSVFSTLETEAGPTMEDYQRHVQEAKEQQRNQRLEEKGYKPLDQLFPEKRGPKHKRPTGPPQALKPYKRKRL